MAADKPGATSGEHPSANLCYVLQGGGDGSTSVLTGARAGPYQRPRLQPLRASMFGRAQPRQNVPVRTPKRKMVLHKLPQCVMRGAPAQGGGVCGVEAPGDHGEDQGLSGP